MPFQKHVFICTNRRDEKNPKGSCAQKGSEALCEEFKKEMHQRGLKGLMRANSSGCLDHCELGPTVVVYPEGVWYTLKSKEDVREVIEEHLIGGRPVQRLSVSKP